MKRNIEDRLDEIERRQNELAKEVLDLIDPTSSIVPSRYMCGECHSGWWSATAMFDDSCCINCGETDNIWKER